MSHLAEPSVSLERDRLIVRSEALFERVMEWADEQGMDYSIIANEVVFDYEGDALNAFIRFAARP